MRLTEKEVIKRLWESAEQYKPLIFKAFNERFLLADGIQVDAVVEISLESGPSFTALVEIVPVATPKNVALKCGMLLDYVRKLNKPDLVPAIVAPYIGRKQAEILKGQRVSWIDLCGNMKVQIPGEIYIERTGSSNKFPDTAPIKKIFQGTSSLVSRVLLLKSEGFGSQYELVDFINSRNANITAGTVSRVLKSLEEDLLVRRTESLISVIDRAKLLDRLTDGYVNSRMRKEIRTYKFAVDEVKNVFYTFFERQVDSVACGFYAAQLKGLATTEQITIFVKDIEKAKKAMRFEMIYVTPDSEFGQLSLIETKDLCLWFNSTKAQPFVLSIVDDVELYLEMMADTPRGPKIARLLKPRILEGKTGGG